MSIYITGDTHGDIDFHKLNSTSFIEGKNLTEKDFVIICGDFGAIWSGQKSDQYLIKWYNEKPWTTLFVDGNHENHDLLNTYPVVYWNGGKVHRISSKILHLMRGQVFSIEGQSFFTMGGATSCDKWWRKEGVSWWANEMPSDAEYDEGFANLKRYNNHIDYILTHCAPDSFMDMLHDGYEHDKLTNYLEVIKSTVDFKEWFCGHYHIDYTVQNQFHFLYYNIIKLK